MYIYYIYPQSGDNHDQETFLAPSADKQTRNCDSSNQSSIIYICIYLLYIYRYSRKKQRHKDK